MKRFIGDVLVPRATTVALWLWVAFNIILILWVGLQSLKSANEVWSSPFALPASPQWQNYSSAWVAGQFSLAALNSVVITCLGATLIVALAAPAAYALARSTRCVAGPMASYFAIGLSIPLQTLAIPIVVARLELHTFMVDWVTGWWDDRITLLLFDVVLSLPFSVFVLYGYFRSLPVEIEEAAEMDGAGPVATLVRVVMPVARPALTTVFVLNLIGLWNEILLVLLIAPAPGQRTLPGALINFYSTMQYSSNWGGLFAGIVTLVYPMVVLFLWLGRRIIEGMTAGIGK